jgi:hypothetical protein
LDLITESPLAGAEPLMTLNHYRQAKFSQLRRELNRLQDLARSLVLQGVHEDVQEKFPLDLNQIFRQELELYQAQPFFKHQVTGEFHFQDNLPLFSGHYIDFSQSFRNLIDNSLEAMEGTDHPRLTVETACRDRRIMLRIGDTGVGIPPVSLPLIFQPFFTTKQTPDGDRAGLGLFMVRRLLAPYQAEIRVDSNPGGTWVTVTFPGLEPLERGEPPSPGGAGGGGGDRAPWASGIAGGGRRFKSAVCRKTSAARPALKYCATSFRRTNRSAGAGWDARKYVVRKGSFSSTAATRSHTATPRSRS